MTRNSDRRKPELMADLVLIGEIAKPHGIRGEVKVYPYSEKPENFKHYKNVFLQEPAESGTKIYKVVKSRLQGKLVILQLESVVSREAAEALQGSKVWLEKTDFPKLDSGEYYWHQLEGLLVITESGQELGKVSKLFSTSAHDIMVVSGAGHEYMIPVEGSIITNIDDQGGKIIISPPPGLLEINK
jgi:16S rRNA processing protein RimM